MKINNMGISVAILAPVSANPNFGLRPKLGGQISFWTEGKDSAKRLIQKVKSLSDTTTKMMPSKPCNHQAESSDAAVLRVGQLWPHVLIRLQQQLTDLSWNRGSVSGQESSD